MCGIVAAVCPDGPDRKLVEAMTARLSHRGPDDERFFSADRVALGFRRLSIIDPEGGRQPVFDETRNIVCVCNGEIYNHGEHRQRLERKGHRFDSDSDAEVIPHLYQEEGDGFLEHLHGMFALVLYDIEKQRLIAARDCLGIKPLYYLETESGLYLASEMKSLLLAPGYRPEVNRAALDQRFTFSHIPGDACLLEGIRVLRPGHFLLCDARRGSYSVAPFYSLPDRPVRLRREEAAAEVARLLDDSVRTRLMSDVPLGVALSGGLDSSAVAASVVRQTGSRIQTFSVAMTGTFDELPYARMVADRFHTDHHELVLDSCQIYNLTPLVMWHLEEPLGSAELPTWYLGRLAREHVRVLLCGEGSDELFGGYAQFQALNLASWLPKPVLRWGYMRGMNGFSRRQRKRLFSPEQQSTIGANNNKYLHAALSRRGDSMLNRFLRYELTQTLRIRLDRLDKLTMAHSVEARVPFLDTRLVNYVVNLPARFKVQGFHEKVLLKLAMRERLPEPILERRKMGLGNPVKPLLHSGFREICYEEFRTNRDTLGRYFSFPAIEELFAARKTRFRFPEEQLFHIFLFLKWHQVFVEGKLPEGVETAAAMRA